MILKFLVGGSSLSMLTLSQLLLKLMELFRMYPRSLRSKLVS